jgi:mono/diheme cytochrome c family protein
MLKFALAGSLVLSVAVAVLSASSQTDAARKKKPDPTRDLYVANCQMCHGEDGRAPVLKEMGFVGRKWKTKTEAEAAKVITDGVPGTAMLPFGGKLTKQQVMALARYVRALDTPAARKKH